MEAASRAHAILMNCNHPDAPRIGKMPWPIDVPHTVCYSVYDWPGIQGLHDHARRMSVPLNIQLGLLQVLSSFHDDQVIELTDCDMLHFRPCPVELVDDGELLVSTIYEDWHLLSLSTNRHVIERYFENGGRYYNGGFVPIVGRVSTFKRILPEWMAVHVDILKQPYPDPILWWAGMYALQAACEKAKVSMVARDDCYVPGINQLADHHYSAHYSVDKRFDKRFFPSVNCELFEDNPFYALVRAWMGDHEMRKAG